MTAVSRSVTRRQRGAFDQVMRILNRDVYGQISENILCDAQSSFVNIL